MEEAWKYIQQHPAVTLTIDLLFIGLVFLGKNTKCPSILLLGSDLGFSIVQHSHREELNYFQEEAS
jgi:hypothetical protein